MSDAPPPSRWTTAHTLTLAGLGLAGLLAVISGVWFFGVQSGRAGVTPPDPTIALRAEVSQLQASLADIRAKIVTLDITAQRFGQTEADLRRTESDLKELRRINDDRDKEGARVIEAMRVEANRVATLVAIIERASDRPLPGSPALRR